MDTESAKKLSRVRNCEPDAPDSLVLLDRYRAGEVNAARELFDRYVERLIALASSRLSRGLRRRVDPEDVVHSAYRSFFIRASEGDFDLRQSGDLWRLLAQITLNKLRKQVEVHTAARRDFRRHEADEAAPRIASAEPSPEEAAAFVDQLRLVTERLSGNERQTLAAFLQGDSVEGIALRLSKSPRTVRRALTRARTLLEREVLGSHSSPPASVLEVPPLENPLPYSDYRLERLIGAGGMGKVYRATKLSTGETVAVKALRRDKQTDSRSVRQFLHEADVIARLRHPGIIRVQGMGRFPSGGYFIVMDWLSGGDLQRLVHERRMDQADAMRLVASVAEAIAYAHESGVIHCDLKPANVLIGSADNVVVSDFGFAQIISGDQQPVAIGGTLGYLAPELLGSDARPTPASDVYSLGALLRNLAPPGDAGIQSIVESCTANDPSKRPTVQELISSLRSMESAA